MVLGTTCLRRIGSALRHPRPLWPALVLALGATLSGCGGGGGAPPPCPSFTDSFGREVSCAAMQALAGTQLAAVDTGGASGDAAGDAGADGTAGDGAPIANADLEFVGANGASIRTRTDASGYYRINLRGLTSPLVATVLRNEKPWKSMLVAEIVRAPANRRFYTVNLTGLTDLVTFEVAKAQGLSTASAVTPTVVSAQRAAIPEIIAKLNVQLATSLREAGLDPATFNPLTTPFVANRTGYDAILDTNPITRNPDGSTSLVNTKFSFTVGDRRVYTITPAAGVPYTNTRTILATQANEVERLENAYSNGQRTAVTTYDAQIRTAEEHYSDGTYCTWAPPLDSYISVFGANIKVGESFPRSSTRTCGPENGTPFPPVAFIDSYTLTGVETVTTAAGVFPNARVWVYQSATFKTIIWVDTVMNRPVFERSFQIVAGVETPFSTTELVAFTIKNYPR